MRKIFFNGDLEISVKDFIWISLIIAGIVGAYIGLPPKIMTEVEQKFYSKDSAKYLEKKVDDINSKVDSLLMHFGIKGIEKRR